MIFAVDVGAVMLLHMSCSANFLPAFLASSYVLGSQLARLLALLAIMWRCTTNRSHIEGNTAPARPYLPRCKPDNFLEANPYLSHVGKSMYYLQIERWIRLFGPNNVKVWVARNSEKYVEDKENILKLWDQDRPKAKGMVPG